MPRVYAGIGSNINREQNIRGAVRELAAHFGHLTLSPVYETRPVGFEGENFYNLVAGFDTGEPVEEIKQQFSRIETRFGRQRLGGRPASRTLDLDLLLYGDTIRHDDAVDLPHPDILRYAFVLRPLAEIAPALRHPEAGMTCAELWRRFDGGNRDMRAVEFRFNAQK